MLKLTVYVPASHTEQLKDALFEAGAGQYAGYDRCAWQVSGEGQFRPLAGSQPFLGRAGEDTRVNEHRVEMLCPEAAAAAVLAALRRSHPYEQPAFDLVRLESQGPAPDAGRAARLRNALRNVPDFPKPGILFKDITPLLADPALFGDALDLFIERHGGQRIDKVAAVEARGFIFAGALAARLGAGVIPIRKQGKLPWQTCRETYTLEYGTATLEMHVDACGAQDRVLLFDDLLATGGTALAAIRLLTRCGARVVGADFLVELAFLAGRERLAGYEVFAPVVC